MPSLKYTCVESSLRAELDHLNLDKVLDHLANYVGNFLLDRYVCAYYILRLVKEQNTVKSSRALAWLIYLARKQLHIDPFNRNPIAILKQFGLGKDLYLRDKALAKLEQHKNEAQRALKLLNMGRIEESLAIAMDSLHKNPSDIHAACVLLECLKGQKGEGLECLNNFGCPQELMHHWQCFYFCWLVEEGLYVQAEQIKAGIDFEHVHENVLNSAAELSYYAGQKEAAIELYERSLSLDQVQEPVRRRLSEFYNPFSINLKICEEKHVAVCLYSHQRAGILKNTLKSLANSRLGMATVHVLLNGSNDDSLKVCEQSKILFRDGSFNILKMKENIGAPAARNTLIAENRKADYIAFIDDDVELDSEWLNGLLSPVQGRKDVGAIGCKILNPGPALSYQYLYRTPAALCEDFFRMSLPAPLESNNANIYNVVHDTCDVMGCCHLLTPEGIEAVPEFDLRFSPSQLDDVCRDLELRLSGLSVIYNGHVSCLHLRESRGKKNKSSMTDAGQIAGNDLKLFYKMYPYQEKLRQLMNQVNETWLLESVHF